MRVFIKHARASLIRPGVSPRPHRLDHPRPRTSPADDVNPPDPSPSPARRACVTGAHRELAEETLPHFEQLKERVALAMHRGEGPDGVAAASVDAASRFARSVANTLDAKVETLEAASAATGERTADLEHVSLARAAWQLAAVYFVEPGEGTGVVTERLVEWYRRNGAALNFGGAGALPVRLRALIDGVAEAGDRPETAGGFWDCLAGLVAMGWSDAAADLVALHSCWAEWRQGMAAARPAAELLEAVVALIRTAPRMATADDTPPNTGDGSYPPSAATSLPQFQAFREAWTRQVRDVLSDHSLFDAVTDDATSDGARWSLEVLAGDETALARACRGGWLELMIASARHQYPNLRAAEHASLAERCVGITGAGESPELDELLGAIIAGDASRTTDVCARYFSPWFIAHLAQMLAAAAGGPAVAYEYGGGERMGSRSASSIAAESHVMTYCASLATRANTRHLALRYLPHCADRGAGAAAQILRRERPPPGSLPPDPGRSDAEADPDVAFAKTLRSLELCADAGLVDVGLGVARAAAADARARGDETGAVAWLHRAGDVAGVAALALEQLPTPHVASADPSGAALALVRLAMGHPGAAEAAAEMNADGARADGAWADGEWRSAGATAAPGPAGFLDALAALRGALTELARAGTTASDAAGAKRAVGSAAVSAAARRAGGKLVALLGHSAGQSHLWTEALFHAVPLLEGAHASLTAKEIQLCMARLEQVSGAGTVTKGDLLRADVEVVNDERDLRAAAARTALARAYARACVSGAGGGRGIVAR